MRITDGQSPRTYRVRWEIDIDANSPLQAAQRAQWIMRNNSEDNLATVFQVYGTPPPVNMIEIDLACTCPDDLPRQDTCPAHGTKEKISNAT